MSESVDHPLTHHPIANNQSTQPNPKQDDKTKQLAEEEAKKQLEESRKTKTGSGSAAMVRKLQHKRFQEVRV